MRCLEILQTAIPIAGRSTAVDKNVGATDEAAAARHEEFGQVANLVRSTGAMGGTGLLSCRDSLWRVGRAARHWPTE